jgi:hypothetical protein
MLSFLIVNSNQVLDLLLCWLLGCWSSSLLWNLLDLLLGSFLLRSLSGQWLCSLDGFAVERSVLGCCALQFSEDWCDDCVLRSLDLAELEAFEIVQVGALKRLKKLGKVRRTTRVYKLTCLFARARSAHNVDPHFSFKLNSSRAFLTTRVGAVKGNLTTNLVRCKWLTGYCWRGTRLNGPSMRTWKMKIKEIGISIIVTCSNL